MPMQDAGGGGGASTPPPARTPSPAQRGGRSPVTWRPDGDGGYGGGDDGGVGGRSPSPSPPPSPLVYGGYGGGDAMGDDDEGGAWVLGKGGAAGHRQACGSGHGWRGYTWGGGDVQVFLAVLTH